VIKRGNADDPASDDNDLRVRFHKDWF